SPQTTPVAADTPRQDTLAATTATESSGGFRDTNAAIARALPAAPPPSSPPPAPIGGSSAAERSASALGSRGQMEGGKLPSESSPDDGRSGHETKPWWNADRVVAVVGVLFGLAVIVQGVVFRRRDRRV